MEILQGLRLVLGLAGLTFGILNYRNTKEIGWLAFALMSLGYALTFTLK